MITLKQLKSDLEAGKEVQFPLVFVYHDVPFVAEQYIDRIKEITKQDVSYVETSESQSNLFSCDSRDILVCFCDDLKIPPTGIDIVVTKKVSCECEYLDIPKLDDIWVKDYLFSSLQGVDKKALEELFIGSKKNIYRLNSEIKKLAPFTKKEKSVVFNSMLKTGQFDDLSSKTIFDITNTILKKDKKGLVELLQKLGSIDCDPVGLSSILYQNFRKYVTVWLARNPTEETTGLKPNVIYAISRQPKVYSKEQLITVFMFMCDIDKQIKLGMVEIPWLLDYMICKIFTA